MAGSETSTAEIRNFPRKGEGEHAEAPHGEAPAPAEPPKVTPEAPRPAPAAPKAAPAQASKPKGGGRRRLVLGLIAVLAIAGGGWWGYNYFTVGRFIVSTDDAYVGGDIAQISPKISGYVAEVNVVANQRVKEGDPLVTLDAGDYQIAVQQAQATIDSQNTTLKRIDAQIAGAQAGVTQAEAQKAGAQTGVTQAEAQKTAAVAAQHNAALQQQRDKSLTASSVGTQATLDTANAALDQANANVTAADAAIAAANANVTAADAAITAAQANIVVLQGQRAEAASALKGQQLALDKANRDLSFTVLRAPYDGVIGNLSVQKGDFVSAGVRLAALVPTDKLYVDANFKETQLSQLVPGSKVTIHVDADDGQPIIGTIESLAPASGSVFSLLPAQNATGNFTKVVQRVPVRIAIPQDVLDSGRLRAGLSVVVDADTRTIPQGAAAAN